MQRNYFFFLHFLCFCLFINLMQKFQEFEKNFKTNFHFCLEKYFHFPSEPENDLVI